MPAEMPPPANVPSSNSSQFSMLALFAAGGVGSLDKVGAIAEFCDCVTRSFWRRAIASAVTSKAALRLSTCRFSVCKLVSSLSIRPSISLIALGESSDGWPSMKVSGGPLSSTRSPPLGSRSASLFRWRGFFSQGAGRASLSWRLGDSVLASE
jgi:hypothetical protein